MSAGCFLAFFFFLIHWSKIWVCCFVTEVQQRDRCFPVSPSRIQDDRMPEHDFRTHLVNMLKWVSLPHFEAVIKKLQKSTTDITPLSQIRNACTCSLFFLLFWHNRGSKKPCVCRPCGHTAGFEKYEVKVERCMSLKRESVCGQGGGHEGWGRGQFKWLLAPQVSHPGVLQRWEGSSRGSSLVLVLSVLLRCNWLAGVSAPLGRFLLGQEPEGWMDAKSTSAGPGP